MVYQRPDVADQFSEPLVRLNKDFELHPARPSPGRAAKTARPGPSIRQDLMWSDGNPVTADDYVATLRYGADPQHAWDFTWYFQGVIKGWDDAIAGEDHAGWIEIGVSAATTTRVDLRDAKCRAPYLPAMLLYSQAALEGGAGEDGPLYNTNPATAVSSGPFILTSGRATSRSSTPRTRSTPAS